MRSPATSCPPATPGAAPSDVALSNLSRAFLAEAALHDPALHGDAVEGSINFLRVVTLVAENPAELWRIMDLKLYHMNIVRYI